MQDYKIAVYIRLSNADEETGSKKDESNSIIHQRMLLNSFLDKHEELSSYPRTEFADDGFSGTNTDRPSFQRMIAAIKAGEYNAICVKDFSRFSRDYIEIGDYLECLFPFLGVRFLSVNDGYDSADYKGTTGGLDVVMRNIVYAAYSKDLSMKVRSAKEQRRKKGHFVDGNVPMGYERDANDKHQLIIDEEAAPLIRRIFRMAGDGCGVSEIAAALNEEGVLSPKEYYQKKHPGTAQKHRGMNTRWTYSSVYSILKRYMYTGAQVSNRKVKTAPCSKHWKKLPKEEWHILENQQPAIITTEEYDRAQQIFGTSRFKPGSGETYPLKSLIRCGCCGLKLTRIASSNSFYCRNHRDDAEAECKNVRYKNGEELENILFQAIQMYISTVDASAKDRDEFRRKKSSQSMKLIEQLAEYQKRAEHLKADKLRVYEAYASGEIDKVSYVQKKKEADAQIQKMQELINRTEEMLAGCEEQSSVMKTKDEELADRFRDAQALTNEMALAFIDTVYVYPDDRIEIKWRFHDPFTET